MLRFMGLRQWFPHLCSCCRSCWPRTNREKAAKFQCIEGCHLSYPVFLADLPRGSVSRDHRALVRLDDAQVFDNFENAVASLCDVHVQPGVMLSGHYFSGTTRPRSNLRVVE